MINIQKVFGMITQDYNWELIQEDINNGLTYKEVVKKHKLRTPDFNRAIKTGTVLIPESNSQTFPKFNVKNSTLNVSNTSASAEALIRELNSSDPYATLELRFLQHCRRNNINAERCESIQYLINNRPYFFTPNFFLPDSNVYIVMDTEEIEFKKESNTDKVFIEINKESLRRLRSGESLW